MQILSCGIWSLLPPSRINSRPFGSIGVLATGPPGKFLGILVSLEGRSLRYCVIGR